MSDSPSLQNAEKIIEFASQHNRVSSLNFKYIVPKTGNLGSTHLYDLLAVLRITIAGIELRANYIDRVMKANRNTVVHGRRGQHSEAEAVEVINFVIKTLDEYATGLLDVALALSSKKSSSVIIPSMEIV
jgi:hypothetical protein